MTNSTSCTIVGRNKNVNVHFLRLSRETFFVSELRRFAKFIAQIEKKAKKTEAREQRIIKLFLPIVDVRAATKSTGGCASEGAGRRRMKNYGHFN